MDSGRQPIGNAKGVYALHIANLFLVKLLIAYSINI